jgi:hypothetical protein
MMQQLSNLCSGFSYVFTLMGTIYIWHGKGSLRKERVAAGKHGQSIAGESGMETKEFKEGNEDETFWMV